MEKTIIIGMNNNFSASANFWLFIFTGIVFLLNGGFHLRSDEDPVALVLGVLLLIAGLIYTFYGLFAFSKNSQFAARVQVDDAGIELKNSLWKPTSTIEWTNLSKIEFHPYRIVFAKGDRSFSFSYTASAEVSKQVKQAIRGVAEQKDIELVNGD